MLLFDDETIMPLQLLTISPLQILSVRQSETVGERERKKERSACSLVLSHAPRK